VKVGEEKVGGVEVEVKERDLAENEVRSTTSPHFLTATRRPNKRITSVLSYKFLPNSLQLFSLEGCICAMLPVQVHICLFVSSK
jgi:hypothetical protein